MSLLLPAAIVADPCLRECVTAEPGNLYETEPDSGCNLQQWYENCVCGPQDPGPEQVYKVTVRICESWQVASERVLVTAFSDRDGLASCQTKEGSYTPYGVQCVQEACIKNPLPAGMPVPVDNRWSTEDTSCQ